jgi:hypothetical protein
LLSTHLFTGNNPEQQEANTPWQRKNQGVKIALAFEQQVRRK